MKFVADHLQSEYQWLKASLPEGGTWSMPEAIQ
jgi:hypothetical protein